MAARAGDDTTWSGDASNVVGAGMSGRGEGDTPSHGDVSIEGSTVDVAVGVVSGEAAGHVADVGGVAGSSVAGADRDERGSSLSSSRSQSISTSFCHCLVFFASGGWISGKGMGGGAGGGGEGVGSVESLPAAKTGGDNCTSSLPAAVATRLHLRRWRHLPTTVLVTAGTGVLQETVKTWHPTGWLITTRAFKPLAMHR
jgi:hypothetical protein